MTSAGSFGGGAVAVSSRVSTAVASATMAAMMSATGGASSMTPSPTPVGMMPTSLRPSTIVALVSMGAFAARASWDQVRSWFFFIARPSFTSSVNGVPVRDRNRRAFIAALGNRVKRAFSSSSTISVRITRWGTPSIEVVRTVPFTGVAK